jgi:putative hydrolase of HD superfamily
MELNPLRLQAAMHRILDLLGHPSIQSLRVKALWEEYEARETPESKFVKDLDLLELAVQAVEYEACMSCRVLSDEVIGDRRD